MITRVYTVMITIHDQRKAIDFYVNKLGMELHMDAPGGFGEGENTNWVEVGPADTQTHIGLEPPMAGPKPGGFVPMVLRCDNAEATCAEFKARGVEITQEVKTEAWGTNFQFKDLDGNEYIVTQEQ